jgi:deoxyribose-phosphate aldolase
MDGAALARRIDYAFLRVDTAATVAALRRVVGETQAHGLRCLVLPPVLAGTAKQNYPTLRVSATLAYPLGTDTLAAKIFALQELIELGVDEIEVVYDLFALANNNRRKFEQEAAQLGEMTAGARVFHKAIIETPVLSHEQVRWACEVLRDSAVDCVKTGTGYGRREVLGEEVRLMRQVLGDAKQIKAAGGVRTLYQVREMLDAGADIVGTSNAVAILEEARAEQTG